MFDVTPDRWMADALCLEYPAAWWFPELGETAQPAKEVCARCLVQRECLKLAITADFRDGVFGETSPNERTLMRRNRVRLAGASQATESRMQKERRLDAEWRDVDDLEEDDDWR